MTGEVVRTCCAEPCALGEVVSVAKNGFHVMIDGEVQFCLVNNSFRPDAPPIVNDVVEIEKREDKYFVIDIMPRKSFVARYDETRDKLQYFAANVDVVFVVTSANREFSPERIRRFMRLIDGQPIRGAVVLTKTDVNKKKFDTQGIGHIVVNALDDNDVKKLFDYWGPGETAMLVGSSGVGKSTIINSLAGLDIKTQEVMGAHKRNAGRHTTSARTLYYLDCGRKIVDNPGVRVVSVLEND